MKIIQSISIHNFRSISTITDVALGDLTCVGGKNNTGKSNILRAISAFFTDEIEPGIRLDMARDCSTKEREKKKIIVKVKFNIGDGIKFPAPLRAVAKKLGKQPTIEKEFVIDKGTGGFKSTYRLNGKPSNPEVDGEISMFIGLFNFRYITSDRTPRRVLESNLDELRAELKYQLNKRKGSEVGQELNGEKTTGDRQTDAIQTIAELSSAIFKPIKDEIIESDSNIADVLISTPSDIVDLISMAQYRITNKHGQVMSERHQGHGIQNTLLFYVLYMVDKNFHRKFGWKIATIWLVEEPETFLHYDLEKRLAKYFAGKALDANERFQAIFTSHSDLFPQYANGHVQVSLETRSGSNVTTCKNADTHDFIRWASEERVSSMPPLATLYPDSPILLVEGHIDEMLLRSSLPRPLLNRIQIFSISRFIHAQAGGDSLMEKFMEENLAMINGRDATAPILFLFDWENSQNQQIAAKGKKLKNGSKVIFAPGQEANPSLGSDWKGIERFLASSFIEACSAYQDGLITKTKGNRYIFEKNDYKKIKLSLLELAKEQEIDSQFLISYSSLITSAISND